MSENTTPAPRVYFFGCWNRPGHFLVGPHGVRTHLGDQEPMTSYGDGVHIDGTLAPRRMKYTLALCWVGRGKTREERERIRFDGAECPEGQFLLHVLDNGFTAISWWDRQQGDKRWACNSTVLLEGVHTVEVMLAAAREHFPSVLANLERAGVQLVDVTPEMRLGGVS